MNISTLKGTVYGAACGDALGVPYEFKKRGSFTCDTEMVGYGTHNQSAGTWSDDTSMMIAMCDSIREIKSVDVDDISNKFREWLYKGKYACGGVVFDVGVTTYRAISSGEGGNNERDNGNGSLMRIAPLAYIDWDSETISNVSAITHAHQISKDVCIEYVHLLRDFIDGVTTRDMLAEMFPELANAETDQIHSGGFVKDTMTAALWCFITTTSYIDCVIKAVNLGDDTDTTAAVAGALAGTYYGYDSIPDFWIDALRDKDVIDSCLFDSTMSQRPCNCGKDCCCGDH